MYKWYECILCLNDFQPKVDGQMACTRCVDHCMNHECSELVHGREAVCQKCIDSGKMRVIKYQRGYDEEEQED